MPIEDWNKEPFKNTMLTNIIKKAKYFIKQKLVELDQETENARYYKVGENGFEVVIKNDCTWSCTCKQGTYLLDKPYICAHITAVLINEYLK